MRTQTHPLLPASLGHQRTLTSLHFGPAGARPQVYIQASLHAEELPGMLVAHHLRAALQTLEAAGRLRGEVVLVPVANPIGLSQRVDHRAMGRFELGTSENFNRHYPVLADQVPETVLAGLGADATHNVRVVREAVYAHLQAWQPQTELQSLRRHLLLLAHGADVVLDLHCDGEAAMHLYTEEACWPALKPLAAHLGCRAVLLAKNSGGSPFDECLSGLWWQLKERLAAQGRHPALPQACASTTVELRGETDVDHTLAQADADALLAYLAGLGVLDQPGTTPPATCQATPLSGSETLNSPVPGVLVFAKTPGEALATGDLVAEVINPVDGAVHPVRAGVSGVFYARVRERYVVAGGEVGKIAGATPFRTGALLGF